MIKLVQFFKCLSDETRLNATLLIHKEGELCVCELMAALEGSQPKISRHLAQLRNCGILSDERRGQWVFYKIHPDLPKWSQNLLDQTSSANKDALKLFQSRLQTMSDRPQCC